MAGIDFERGLVCFNYDLQIEIVFSLQKKLFAFGYSLGLALHFG